MSSFNLDFNILSNIKDYSIGLPLPISLHSYLYVPTALPLTNLSYGSAVVEYGTDIGDHSLDIQSAGACAG